MKLSFPVRDDSMTRIRDEMNRIEATFNTAKVVIRVVSQSFGECSGHQFDMLENLVINPSDTSYESAFTFKVIFGRGIGRWGEEHCTVRATFSLSTWSIRVTSHGTKGSCREKHLIEDSDLANEVVRLVEEVDKDSSTLTKSAAAA